MTKRYDIWIQTDSGYISWCEMVGPEIYPSGETSLRREFAYDLARDLANQGLYAVVKPKEMRENKRYDIHGHIYIKYPASGYSRHVFLNISKGGMKIIRLNPASHIPVTADNSFSFEALIPFPPGVPRSYKITLEVRYQFWEYNKGPTFFGAEFKEVQSGFYEALEQYISEQGL